MARFYGCNLTKKPQIDRTVLSWLQTLPDTFSVFVELEGGDFSVDFLVLKPLGIFNVEAKGWRVREARRDADWVLEDGETRQNPFLFQVNEQCSKIADYLMVQRLEVFGSAKGQDFVKHRNRVKIFPVIALSNPNLTSLAVETHPWRKVFADEKRLRSHLLNWKWFPDREKTFEIAESDVKNLVNLFHLESVDHRSLEPTGTTIRRVNAVAAPMTVAAAPALAPTAFPDPNPYQYTYTVTGDEFYGRSMELQQLRRCLQQGTPLSIIGLQRTGKSSLVKESIRRLCRETPYYDPIHFDFRSIRSEGPKPEEDLTLEFVRSFASEVGDSELAKVLAHYRDEASRSNITDQRRLFREALRKNRARNRRTILFLDECQEIGDFFSETRYTSFVVYLDSLCRERELGLNVIIACRPAFFEFLPIKNINLGRLFEPVTLGVLEEEAALEIVNRGAARLTFTDDAKARILFLTGRHPFWVQFLCHKLFEKCILTNNAKVDIALVNSTFNLILHDTGCKPQFYLLYQDVESFPDAFRLLKAMATASAREGQVLALSSLPLEGMNEESRREALRQLNDNQIITIEHELSDPTLAFRVEALRLWMRSHLSTA